MLDRKHSMGDECGEKREQNWKQSHARLLEFLCSKLGQTNDGQGQTRDSQFSPVLSLLAPVFLLLVPVLYLLAFFCFFLLVPVL